MVRLRGWRKVGIDLGRAERGGEGVCSGLRAGLLRSTPGAHDGAAFRDLSGTLLVLTFSVRVTYFTLCTHKRGYIIVHAHT